jgi:hypothetical protein
MHSQKWRLLLTPRKNLAQPLTFELHSKSRSRMRYIIGTKLDTKHESRAEVALCISSLAELMVSKKWSGGLAVYLAY